MDNSEKSTIFEASKFRITKSVAPMRERGLEQNSYSINDDSKGRSHAGAWIETKTRDEASIIASPSFFCTKHSES